MLARSSGEVQQEPSPQSRRLNVPYRILNNNVWPIVIPDASGVTSGLLSFADKAKLDSIDPASTDGFVWWFNVRDYGAVGDGVTNDSDAFSAAILAALAAGGGTVYAPYGNYRFKSFIPIINVAATNPTIHFIGDGAATVLIPEFAFDPNNPFMSYYGIYISNVHMTFEKIRFNGITVPSGYTAFGLGTAVNSAPAQLMMSLYSRLTFIDVEFDSLSLPESMVTNIGGWTYLQRVRVGNNMKIGLAIGDALFSMLGSVEGWKALIVEDCHFGDNGNIFTKVGHMFYCKNPQVNGPEASYINQQGVVITNSTFGDFANYEAVRIVPDAGYRLKGVTVRDCSFHVADMRQKTDGSYRAAGVFYISRAENVLLDNVWNGYGGLGTYSAAYTFVDAGRVRMNQVYCDGDDAFRPPLQGALYVSGDSLTKSITITDSHIDTVEAECPVVIEQDGLRTRNRKATLVDANTLVKLDSGNAGQVVPLGTSDAASVRVGVAIEGSAKASFTVTFDATKNIAEGDTITLNDGVNADHLIKFTLSGTSYPGALAVVSVNNGMTSAQRATASFNALDPLSGAGFRFTMSVNGAVVTGVNLVEGIIGNRPVPFAWGHLPVGTVGAVDGAIVVNGVAGGRSFTRIAGAPGDDPQIKSDGTTVIAVGDDVEPSPTVAGRIRKGSTNRIGRATSAASAILDVLVRVVLQ